MLVLLATACAVGKDTEDPTFGDPTFDPTAASTTSNAEGSDISSGSGDSGEATSDASGTSGEVGETSSPDSTSTTSSDDTAGSTTEDLGMQPDSGMYSECLSTAECVGQDACITVLDAQQNPIDGFCSKDDCVDPGTDCDPSPGGTAVPVCFSLMLMGAPADVCALDCSQGQTCPGGMTCQDVTGGSICV